MKAFFTAVWRRRGVALFVIVVVLGAGYVWSTQRADDVTTLSAMVVETVALGSVTTGIQTSGTIEAAEVLDLNVYKTTKRIDALAVQNGVHVDAGQLLFAFDESDVTVEINSSELSVREAELALTREREAVVDPNTTIRSLENDIAVLEQNLVEYADDKRDALRDFLNTDLEAVPSEERYDDLITRTAPSIGGTYLSTEQGVYTIRVYSSGARSGFSYALGGLEEGIADVIVGSEVSLGTRGLTITFPSDTSSRDEWIVAVPNVHAPEYPTRVEDYESDLATINEQVQSDTVSLANKRTQLAQARREDTTADRTLGVQSAELAIERARVDLEQGLETQGERRVIAPFSGTVEGMENVVVGATPKNDNSDSIDLGVLISDEFLVTFLLGASDVDKVTLGQKVLVTLTSVPDSVPLTAEVTEISSLPDSGSVAQYSVRARLTVPETGVRLRDGMLADVEIVQEERESVLRVPSLAVSYREGQAYVTVVENLSETQQAQAARMGIVRTDGGTQTTYERAVTLGLRGQYYVEVIAGLTEGEMVKVSSTATADATETGATVRTGFGGGGGMRPPSE